MVDVQWKDYADQPKAPGYHRLAAQCSSPRRLRQPSLDTIEHSHARARKAQTQFLAAYEELGTVLGAARVAKISRTSHYNWLKDPMYRERFRAVDRRATQRLIDEAVRRARYGVVRMVLYKGQPVIYQGKPLVEHQYSDRLMIKLLEAKAPDQFNRQKVALFEGDSTATGPADTSFASLQGEISNLNLWLPGLQFELRFPALRVRKSWKSDITRR